MIALAVFLLCPITGDQIYIVTGIVRVVFSLASVLLVFAFYKNMVNIPKIVSVPLTHLSVVTYGVYLLHPIIYRIVIVALKKMHIGLAPEAIIGITMVFTAACAMVAFKLPEQPFIRLGKRLTSRPATHRETGTDGLPATK